MDLRESLNEPVSDYMSTTYSEVSGDDSVTSAAKTMQKSRTTEALVLKEGKPIGIVTERDIIYKVVAAGSDPSAVKVREIMSSPVETVEETSKVLDAISRMSKLGVRRLAVTRNGKIVGMVTQKAMVSGGLHQNVALPELAAPNRISCPYCDQVMKSQDELSRHIDQVHLGLGLLEGNRSKW